MTREIGTYADDYSALSTIYCAESSSLDLIESYTRFLYIKESENCPEIVIEAAGDVVGRVVEGIKHLIESIVDFFKRIILYLKALFGDISDVSAVLKKRLSEMPDIAFTISGFNFTVLDKSGPNMIEFQNIVNRYNEDIRDISKLKIDDIKHEINDWLDTDHINTLRGQVLGTNRTIDADDFQKEIRAYFRNDAEHASDIKVDRVMINEIINHASKLESVRDAAIKDRDKLITLLTKTEEFFTKTIYPTFKGTTKTMNLATVDVKDDKFSTKTNYTTVNDTQAVDISAYTTLKSRQVNVIGSIISTVACERANALKDQVAQEKKILKRCLFNYNEGYTKKTDTTKALNLDLGDNGVDFVSIAEQSHTQLMHQYNIIHGNILAGEAKLLLESKRTGEIHYLMEADTTKASGKIKESILNLVAALIKKFREKSIANRKKYEPWINDIYGKHKSELLEKAKNHAGLKMYEFWKVQPKTVGSALGRAITTAYSTSDFSTVAFAEPYLKGLVIDGSNVSALKVEHLNSTEIRKPLLNYFRVGDSSDKISPVVANGSTLASQLDGMCNYILKYDDMVSVLNHIQNALSSAVKKISITESTITGSTYLALIGKTICESELTLCKDYNKIFGSPMRDILEVTGTATGGNTTSGNVRAAVNANAKAASAEKENGEQAVTSVQDMGNEEKEKAGASGIKQEKTNDTKAAYKRAVDHFFKIAIACYEQAREEQFIVYLNAIAEIAGARPKFDKNDAYVPVTWGSSETGDNKAVNSNDDTAKAEPVK